MLNDFRPQPGVAGAQALYSRSTAGLPASPNPPTGLADHEADAPLTGVPLPTSTTAVATRGAETGQRLGRVWNLLNDRGFVALKESSVAGQRAAYWMVLLTLFTNMRATGLASLRPSDFAWASCSGHLVRQPPSKWGRGQLHPVHRVLIQCGLLDFIAERWAAKAVHLLSDSTKPGLSRQSARRYVSRAWNDAGHSTPAPSWSDFRVARRAEATKVLLDHPELQARLEASCRHGGLPSVDKMQLVLDLEGAIQFDDVSWDRHYSVEPVR
ncbi:MAG: hypothetical protein V4792_02895 [Pseudomonadota bacterium]